MTLITGKQASSKLCVSISTVQRLADKGAFPRYKIGRTIRYNADDIDTYITGSKIIMPAERPHPERYIYIPGMKVV